MLEEIRPFYDVIIHLRKHEAILFHSRLVDVSQDEQTDVITFLKEEYQRESLDFPFRAPQFDGEAAIWAAKIVFFASQLLLIRDATLSTVEDEFKSYERALTPGAILSADLCLRFLPEVFQRIYDLDATDPILPILEKILLRWHYSGMNIVKDEVLDFDAVLADKCLSQLYVDRVIQEENKNIAACPEIKPLIQASLGNHFAEIKNKLKL